MRKSLHILIILFFLAQNPAIFAIEQINTTIASPKSFKGVELVPEIPNYFFKSPVDKPLSTINFQILDSLANAYSYFSESQQPFVYVPKIRQLITIKRGYWDIDKYPEYTGDDTKNNLFIRYSTDWGKSWSNPILVYKVPSGTQYATWRARYPSVYAFDYEGDIAYVYTAPCTDGSGWVGFVNGLYYQNNFFQSFSKSFTWKDGNRYNWGGTDSRIVGGMDGSDPYAIAVGTIMIEGGLPLTHTSHLGYRRTTDFDKWNEVIPPQWEASKYKTPVSQNDSVRSSLIAGFKFADDGYIYMAAYANFANLTLNRFFFGVSKSTDLGKTWSDFEFPPENLFDSYLQEYGLNTSLITWGQPQFVPLGNDNYTFLVNINEDTTQTFRLWENALHQLVEVYKQNGVWGVRKVSDLTGYVLAYVAPTSSNQLGDEAQLVRTVDGLALVAKWTDFVDVVVNDTVYPRATNDIFVSVRRINSPGWSKVKNITESFDYDRITWLPDMVPSNLRDIPILKLASIPIEGQTAAEARLRQRMLDTVPQYLLVGFFDADDVLNVEEEIYQNPEITNLKVYPNPMSEIGSIEFVTSSPIRLTIDLYDVFGKKVMNIFDGNTFAGVQGVTFKTNNLASGVYNVVVEYNGIKKVMQINILK
ncbi:MAG: T9SS type A sorting domain-containing protein [Ignavibacteria bacterium]|nr:T9SS type A sorting domain-containing protein [Ignavibacteria bacterium]